MFTFLFGLHLALRSVIDWIWNGHKQHRQQQNDLDPDPDPGRSVSDHYDEPDAGRTEVSQRQALSQNRFNKLSARWDDKKDNRPGSGIYERDIRYGSERDELYIRYGSGRGERGIRYGLGREERDIRPGSGRYERDISYGSERDERDISYGAGGDGRGIRYGAGSDERDIRYGSGMDERDVRPGSGRDERGIRYGSGRDERGVRPGLGRDERGIRYGSGRDERYIRYGSGKDERNIRPGSGRDERDIRYGSRRDERDIRYGSGRDESAQSERTGFGSRKRVSYDQNNSGMDDMVVPVKVAHLSSPVVAEKTEQSFDVQRVHGYQNMPFLSDCKTVNFIKHSHTMIIMRGLPGSGKSAVVKCLQDIYRGSVATCSADNYFMGNDGSYNFDAKKLSEAHQYCQNKASYHCDKGTRVVIIDNTNIQRWEMSFYMKLAQSRYYYHVIIVEPQTPWRYEPAELAKRNKHNVDEGIIARKLKTLRDSVYSPLYYGWFLCKDDSSMLVRKSREVLKQCVKEVVLPDLSDHDDSANFSALEEILSNVVISYTDPVPMLHCTAAYLARRLKDPYHMNEYVHAALGRKFHLCISGFVYSKQALSARVSLQGSVDASTAKGSILKLDDLLTTASGGSRSDPISQADLSEIYQTDSCPMNKTELYMKDEEESLCEKFRDVNVHMQDSDEKHALFRQGCSAHVTISYATEGQSKQSGEDILNILKLEFHGKVKQKSTSLGVVSAYGKDIFQIQLNRPLVVNSLFQGFYSSRG